MENRLVDTDCGHRLVDTVGKEKVGLIGRISWEHIYYHMQNR